MRRPLTREEDLRAQAERWLRVDRFDGHNRKPQGTSMTTVRGRSRRRWLNEQIRHLASDWEQPSWQRQMRGQRRYDGTDR